MSKPKLKVCIKSGPIIYAHFLEDMHIGLGGIRNERIYRSVRFRFRKVPPSSYTGHMAGLFQGWPCLDVKKLAGPKKGHKNASQLIGPN